MKKLSKKEIENLKTKQDIDPVILKQLKENFSDKELKIIAGGGKFMPGQGKVPIIDFEGERIRFGFMTDPHIGSIYFVREWLESALQEFKKQKCEFIALGGDITEGMSKRDGHLYELVKFGYNQQKEYAINLLNQWSKKIYAISGNHDLWYYNNSDEGALIVKDICEKLKDAEYLGEHEGYINLKGLISVGLWHGIDGASAYALSYRPQKIIEGLTGGQKPHMLLGGHSHKSIYIPGYRNVEYIAGGAISKQSKFMRYKKCPCHSGFWIIDVWINKQGITKCQPTWHPFYS